MYHISWVNHVLRLLKKHEGKFLWNKHKACITRNGKLFPAYELFPLIDNPPVISVLPVPPPHVRPPLFVDGELKGENDLTYRLQNIIRKNRALNELKDARGLKTLLIRLEKPCKMQSQDILITRSWAHQEEFEIRENMHRVSQG